MTTNGYSPLCNVPVAVKFVAGDDGLVVVRKEG